MPRRHHPAAAAPWPARIRGDGMSDEIDPQLIIDRIDELHQLSEELESIREPVASFAWAWADNNGSPPANDGDWQNLFSDFAVKFPKLGRSKGSPDDGATRIM